MCVCVKGRDVHVARRSDIYNTCYLQHNTKMTTMKSYGERLVCVCEIQREREGGGAGVETQKMYGEYLGDGVEYHLMSPTPRR